MAKNKFLLYGGLAAAAAGLFFLTRKASAAAGNDPNSPPPVSDPSKTRGQLLTAWQTWIPTYLQQYGYALAPSYNGTTFQIADAATGDFSRLVQRNQAATDNNLGFWWKVKEIQDGKSSLDNDATWLALQDSYAKWLQLVTPEFLAK